MALLNTANLFLSDSPKNAVLSCGMLSKSTQGGVKGEISEQGSLDEYEDLRVEVSSGPFGVVRLMRERSCRWSQQGEGDCVAVKTIPLEQVSSDLGRELLLFAQLEHSCIARFRRVFVSPPNLVVVAEATPPRSTLMHYVDRRRLTEPQARYLFQQVYTAVEFCHSVNASPRDLRLESFIVTSANPPQLKLSALGYTVGALRYGSEGLALANSIYAAPEVLKAGRKCCNSRLPTPAFAADVWSLGVILYALLFHAYPFTNSDHPADVSVTFQRIMTGVYKVPGNTSVSSAGLDMLKRMFEVDPSKRITMKDIRQHEWFQQNLPRRLQTPFQATVGPLADVIPVLESVLC